MRLALLEGIPDWEDAIRWWEEMGVPVAVLRARGGMPRLSTGLWDSGLRQMQGYNRIVGFASTAEVDLKIAFRD